MIFGEYNFFALALGVLLGYEVAKKAFKCYKKHKKPRLKVPRYFEKAQGKGKKKARIQQNSSGYF